MLQKKGGLMIVLSSPSGAGKTTLVKLLSKKIISLYQLHTQQENQGQMNMRAKIIFLLTIMNLKD